MINVIATTNIKYKDPITISYVEPSCGTLERRAYLLDNFYFSCKCSRCRDPTEIGTYLSSVKCTSDSCKNGWLISKNPIDPNSNWICNQNLTAGCNASDVNVMLVEDILQDVKAKIRKAGSLNEFMDILEFYKNKTLHKNHYLVINMECEILRLIDVALSTVFDEPERLRLAKWQVDLCRHCLSGNKRLLTRIILNTKFIFNHKCTNCISILLSLSLVADLIQPGNNKFRGGCISRDFIEPCEKCHKINDSLIISRKSLVCPSGCTVNHLHRQNQSML